MKRIVLSLFALLGMTSSYAQHSIKLSQRPEHKALLNTLLQQNQSPFSAGKTTGIPGEHVVAQSTWDMTLSSKSDSIYLGYAPGCGSKYDYNSMLYAYNYPYSTSPVFNNNGGIFGRPQVLFDTFMRWTIDPNTLVYGYSETAYGTYNSQYNLTSYLDLFVDSVINPNMTYTNKFNSAKNIDTAFAYVWKAGVADSAFRQFYKYNAANKLVEDSTYEYHLGMWRLGSRTLYTYDGSNNLVQIDNYTNTTDTSFLLPLTEQFKYVNTYDGSNRLLSVFSSFFDGTTLSPYIKDTFTYSGTYAYHNTWKEYQYDPINGYWAPMFYMNKIINSTTGLPDTVNIQGFDSLLNTWVPQTVDVMTYNSSHDPVMLKDYEYNFTSFPSTPNFITYYYYNPYTIDNTGIKGTLPASGSAVVYPNPATNTISISRLNVPANTPVSVLLMNIRGQVVSRNSLHWQNEAHIPVGDLTPGVYWVVIQDDAGNLLHRQAVVKE